MAHESRDDSTVQSIAEESPSLFSEPIAGSTESHTTLKNAEPICVTQNEDRLDSSDEDDIELEVTRRYLAEGRNRLQSNPSQAETFLRKAMSRYSSSKSHAAEIPQVMLEIAAACYECDKLQESMGLCEDLTRATPTDDESRERLLSASHLMAKLYLRNGFFDAALAQCKKTLTGRRRLRGKDDAYFRSVALMATIYESRGDEIEALTYVGLLPAGFTRPEFKSPKPELSVSPRDSEPIERPPLGLTRPDYKISEPQSSFTSISEPTLVSAVTPDTEQRSNAGEDVASYTDQHLDTTVHEALEQRVTEASDEITTLPPAVAARISRRAVDVKNDAAFRIRPEADLYGQDLLERSTSRSPEYLATLPTAVAARMSRRVADADRVKSEAESTPLSPEIVLSPPESSLGSYSAGTSPYVIISEPEHAQGSRNLETIEALPNKQLPQHQIFSSRNETLNSLRHSQDVPAHPSPHSARKPVPDRTQLRRRSRLMADSNAANSLEAVECIETTEIVSTINRPTHPSKLLLSDRARDQQSGDSMNNAFIPLHPAEKDAAIQLLYSSGFKFVNRFTHTKDSDLQTHFLLAAKQGQESVVRLLLTDWECYAAVGLRGKNRFLKEAMRYRKVSPNTANERNETALHLAAIGGHSRIVRALLDNGATRSLRMNGPDLDEKQTRVGAGASPIECAIRNGHTETVRELLRREFNRDLGDHQGWTLLHHATFSGNMDIFSILLAKGLDARIAAKDGTTALHVAAQNGKVDVLKALLGLDIDVDQRNQSGYTPLSLAVFGGQLDCMTELLNVGADITAKDSHGSTLLHIAAQQDRSDILADLVFGGISVDAQDSMGQTSLHRATHANNVASVDTLLALGAKVGIPDDVGNSAIHVAAIHGSHQVVGKIISAGADTNQRNTAGQSPLMLAAANKRLVVGQQLIAANANLG